MKLLLTERAKKEKREQYQNREMDNNSIMAEAAPETASIVGKNKALKDPVVQSNNGAKLPLETSQHVVDGLKYLDTIISLDVSRKLIANCVKLMLHPNATIPTMPEIYANNADKAKQSEYAVTTLFALATRLCCKSSDVQEFLESLKLTTLITEELVRMFDEHRREFTLRQLELGFNFPHITDIQWRIVCDAKSSTSDYSSGEVGFQINLGRYETDSGGDRVTVAEFMCNQEELQSLIDKLKDVERYCEKMAND